MTDKEFQQYLSRGVNVRDQIVTARVSPREVEFSTRASLDDSSPQFVLCLNDEDEIAVTFEPEEEYEARMAKVERAVERWLMKEGREG